MQKKTRNIGIDAIGNAQWGAHFCLFYQTREDLLELLVPYFKAGLENNEYCMWITSEPLTTKDAELALKKAVPDFSEYLKKGQIEIIPHTEWYLLDGYIDWQRTMNSWVKKLDQAQAKGFDGLRASGDTFWLTEKDWRGLNDYESAVHKVIDQYKMLAICAYSLEKYGFYKLMDVVSKHQFVLLKSAGQWKRFMSSEQVKLEQELKKCESIWRSITNCTPDIIMLLDMDANILFINHTTPDLTPAEVLGKSIYNFAAKQDLEKVKTSLASVLKTGKPDIHEAIYIDKGGNTHYFESKVGPVWEDDNITGFVMRTTEITERKKIEEERRRYQTAKFESLSTLASGIAHDFNNILTGILGNISLAKQYAEPDRKIAARLEAAEKASLRAKDLTQRLLTFAKSEVLNKKLIFVQELIKDTVDFVLSRSKVRPIFFMADEIFTAEVDESQISQVISNLVINADEAMPKGGVLNIKASNVTKNNNNYIEIVIEDHGTGIAKENLSKIFDPYFTTKEHGYGLGLSTTYAIIKNHDGYITVASKQNVGTNFSVYLPAHLVK